MTSKQCNDCCPFCMSSSCCSKSPNYFWRDYVDGNIPCDALPGPDGKFIGQVCYDGKILPPQITANYRSAIAERYGKRIIRENIKILCTFNPEDFIWEPINFAYATEDQMRNAVKGGSQSGYDLFVGKACHEGEWKIGKVLPRTHQYKGLRVWNQCGARVTLLDFHILKYSCKHNPVACCC
ncbi:hypothetical protein Trydic_g15252 [Trypoxylus dichotomus]